MPMKSFELKKGLLFYENTKQKGLKTVLVSLVGLQGSSYRKPGVRMFIAEDGSMSGAISGGCVEKEVYQQALSVFQSGVPKIISYDGRFRLGCEGFLYILIEAFTLETKKVAQLVSFLNDRQPLEIITHYKEALEAEGNFGSYFKMTQTGQELFIKSTLKNDPEDHLVFRQTVLPNHQLIVIGAEHDAERLCEAAAFVGWEVVILASAKSIKSNTDFPKAKSLHLSNPDSFDFGCIDVYTSVVIMTHSYQYDLQYLIKLSVHHLSYIGILGSSKRKYQLENDLLEFCPELEDHFLEAIHSPAGLSIGAVTPEEISISIIAEIMKVTQAKEQILSREKAK